MIQGKFGIGTGLYTLPEISNILRLPYHKANLWISKYWDGELGKVFEGQYSWKVGLTKAINFQTLIEFYILILLAESGVKTREVLNAHKELSRKYNTPYPFSKKNILDKIRTEGKKIFLELEGDIISLDGTKQLNLIIIRQFFKNLDFDDNSIVSKFWPLGRDKSIVVDPKKQFGHATIDETNIFPQTIFNMYKAGEPIEFIAFAYELNIQSVKDAIQYCSAA